MKKFLAIAFMAASVLAVPVAAQATTGKGAATPFTAAPYTINGAVWTCTGAHVVNHNFIKDSETCVLSGDLSLYVPGSYSGIPWGYLTGYGNAEWSSDFNGAIATSWKVDVVDNGNGTFTANIVALY